MSEFEDVTTWYLEFCSERKPSVTYFAQYIPVDALVKVKQEFESLKASVQELERQNNQLIYEKDKSTHDHVKIIQSLEARLAEAGSLLSRVGTQCLNAGMYGPLKIQPGKCDCVSCDIKKFNLQGDKP